jgi:hypothetical protein
MKWAHTNYLWSSSFGFIPYIAEDTTRELTGVVSSNGLPGRLNRTKKEGAARLAPEGVLVRDLVILCAG